ncbi:MAG: hypothetical protein AAF702_22095 [Chloroflexota bacterium]
MEILLLSVGGLAFFGLLIWLLSFYWRRIIDKNITVHFRAAESITEHDQLPSEWIEEINHKVGSTAHTLFGFRKLSGVALMLEKIDATMRFFDEGSFYADDTAKQILLSELADARKRIEQMSWEEVLLEHNQIRNLT